MGSSAAGAHGPPPGYRPVFDELARRLRDASWLADGWSVEVGAHDTATWLTVGKPAWRASGMEIHFESWVRKVQIARRSVPVAMHVEGGHHARRYAFNERFHAAVADVVRGWHGYTVSPAGMTRLLAAVPLEAATLVPALEAEYARLARLARPWTASSTTCAGDVGRRGPAASVRRRHDEQHRDRSIRCGASRAARDGRPGLTGRRNVPGPHETMGTRPSVRCPARTAHPAPGTGQARERPGRPRRRRSGWLTYRGRSRSRVGPGGGAAWSRERDARGGLRRPSSTPSGGAWPRPARAACPGDGGVRTWPTASGGRSARTTPATARPGRPSRTTTPARAPIAGTRTVCSGSATTRGGSASLWRSGTGPTRS